MSAPQPVAGLQAVLQAEDLQLGSLHVLNTNDKHGSGGSHGENSLYSLGSALVPSLLAGLTLTLIFLFFRKKTQRIYQPRTYLGTIPKEERTPVPEQTWLSWIRDFWSLSDDHALNSNSLDAYLLLRFFRVLILTGICGVLITWPILLPINATGGGDDVQLDALILGNVKDNSKLYAHAVLAWVFSAFILLVITRETMYYINLRLAILSSPRHRSRISSKVVLFTSVPSDLLSEDALKQALKGVTRVWIPKDDSELEKATKRRDELAEGLEKAHLSFNRNAHEAHGSNASVEEVKRPRHRTRLLVGNKVDSIDWYRQQLDESLKSVKELRGNYLDGSGQPGPAAFVEFESLEAAQLARKRGLKTGFSELDSRYLGLSRDDVVWENLGLKFTQRKLRQALTTSVIIAMIIFWSIPVAFIGTISKLDYLTEKFPFLEPINDLPKPILGVITGLLPQLLLSSIMSLVPNICRFVARLSGEVSSAEIEMTTQTWYFAFSFIQVFFVTAISSGVASSIQKITDEPKQAAYILAKKLPTSADFYTSYFVLYGLGNAPKIVLNMYDLFMVYVVGRFLDKTPRQAYQRQAGIRNLNFGSNLPKFTNLGVIAISYACIAPLVLGFATVGLFLIYLAFRYNVLYAFGTKGDRGGHMYNRALQQLMVGVYISELCLLGLFSLRKAFGPLALMILLLGSTALYHFTLNIALGKLTKSYPTFPIDGQSSSIRDRELDELFLRFDNRLGDPSDLSDPSSTADNDDSNSNNDTTPLLARASPTFISTFFNAQLFRVPSAHQLSLNLLGQIYSEPVPSYSEWTQQHAYDPPGVFASKTPTTLWVPRDAAGLGSKEIARTRDVVDITDEKVWFGEKGRVEWEKAKLEDMPVFKAKVYY